MDIVKQWAYRHASMKVIKLILVSGAVTLLVSSCASNLGNPSTRTSAHSSAPRAVSSHDRAIAERVFRLVNAERARAGKRAMRGHGGLNVLAQKHSNQMAKRSQDANHMGSQNRAQYAYLKYNIENLSEMTYAVPAGTGDPAAVAVSAWKASPTHYKHMLQSWDLTGIGVASGANGVTYVTMCMGARPMGVPRSVLPVGW